MYRAEQESVRDRVLLMRPNAISEALFFNGQTRIAENQNLTSLVHSPPSGLCPFSPSLLSSIQGRRWLQ